MANYKHVQKAVSLIVTLVLLLTTVFSPVYAIEPEPPVTGAVPGISAVKGAATLSVAMPVELVGASAVALGWSAINEGSTDYASVTPGSTAISFSLGEVPTVTGDTKVNISIGSDVPVGRYTVTARDITSTVNSGNAAAVVILDIVAPAVGTSTVIIGIGSSYLINDKLGAITVPVTATSGDAKPSGAVELFCMRPGESEVKVIPGSSAVLVDGVASLTKDLVAFDKVGSYVFSAGFIPDDSSVFSASTSELLEVHVYDPTINTVNITPISAEKASDDNLKFNQGAVTLSTGTFTSNRLTAEITVNKPLRPFVAAGTDREKLGSQQWIGLLVTTNVEANQLYYGTAESEMSQLGASTVQEAVNLGAQGSKTFVIWTKVSDYTAANGYAVSRYIKNGLSGNTTEIRLGYTDFVAPVITTAYANRANPEVPTAASQPLYRVNQNAVTVWSNTYIKNYLNINLQGNLTLHDYTLADGSTGKWIGVLVTTDAKAANLYLGSDENEMKPLSIADNNTARAYGADDDKTFLLWVKTQEFVNGSTARYIKNGEYGTVVKLNLNYIPPAIGVVHVSPVTKEKVTDTSSKQNQSTLSINNTALSGNEANTSITANGRLEAFRYDTKAEEARWLGLLVTTDTDVTELYYGANCGFMHPLTAEDRNKAVALGAIGTKTFVLWLDADELKQDGTVVRYIKNGENGIPKKLKFTLIHNHITVQEDGEVYTLDKGSVEAAVYTNVTGAKVRFTATAKDDSGKLISANSFIAMQTAAPISVVNEIATIKYSALKEGKVTVTAELVDASGRSFYPPIREACNLSIKPSAVVTSLDIVDNLEVVPKFTLDKGVAADGTTYYGSKQLDTMVGTVPDSEHFKTVIWKSSNEKVAKVDSNGLVTAVGAGSADITATTNYKNASGSFLSKKAVVTVKQHLTGASLSMGVNKNSVGQYILIKGDSKLGASVLTKLTPSDAALKDVAVIYTSSDNNIVKVSSTGIITAAGAGEATVTAAVNEKVAPADSKLKKLFETQIKVKVYGSLVNAISLQKEGKGCLLNDSIISLNYLKENKLTLSAAVNENTYNAVAFSYSGSNSIFVKDNGNNTATITILDTGSGTGTIIARALDGSNKQASVKVTTGGIPVSAVNIAPGTVTVGVGKNVSLTAAITPPEATYKTLKWVSANPNYVTVDQKGILKGIQPTAGNESIKVTAYATDGSGCSAQVDVKVSAAALSVKITAVEDAGNGITYDNADTVSVDLKDKAVIVKLQAATNPDSASKAVIWKSSDSKVASVDADGTVTVNAKGKATITATTTDGSGKADTIQLMVTQKVYGVLLTEPSKWEHDLDGTLLAKAGASSIKPVIAFNNGSAASAPVNAGYKLDVYAIPGDSGSTYIKISNDSKSFTVAPNAIPGCYFQIKAVSTENSGIISQPLTFKIVSAKGELTTVDVTVPFDVLKDDVKNNILLASKKEQLSALCNQGKSLPNGIVCTWKAYEADKTGAYTPGQSEIKNLITASGVLLSKDSGNIGKYIAVEVTAQQGSRPPVSNHAIFKVYSPVQGMKIILPVNGGKLAYGGATRAVWVCKNDELGDKGYYRNAVWTTSDPLVADVQPDADGCNIKAVGKGTAKITVTALDGSGAQATVTVMVGQATVPVNKLELNYTKVALKPGESLDVTAVLSAKPPIPGASITDNGVIWSIQSTVKGKDIANFGYLGDGTPVLQKMMPSDTNPRIIKIYAGNDSGTVTLIAKAKDGCGAQDSMDVVVADTGKINGITLSAPKSTAVVISGDSVTNGTPILLRGRSLKLNAQITPANAINKTLAYSVTDIDGRTVTGITVDWAGNVKADNKASAGYILVKAAATDGSGKSDTIKLYVAPAATAIRLSPDNPSVKPGESLLFVADGENCDNNACSIKWVSHNPSIAWFTNNITKSGEQNYLVIAKDVGSATSVTIDAYATDGSGKFKTVTVKLGNPVEKIIISNSSCKNPTLQDGNWSTKIPGDEYPRILLQGRSMQFTAVVTPTNAPNKAIVYAVEPVNDVDGQANFAFNGVTIDKSGLLKVAAPTAKGAPVYQGFVKVTAKATDQVIAAQSNSIYVYIAPVTTKLAILPATLTGEPNRFYELSALATGAGDCSGAVAWKSSNSSVASLNKAVTFSGRDSVRLTIAVDTGTVKSVVITATMLDGSNTTVNLTVNIGSPVTKVTIKSVNPVIYNGSTLQLSAITNPAIPATQGVNWEISKGKELGVTIDANGKLATQKMVKNGTITVVAYAKDNNGAYGMLDLDVRQYVTSVTILKDDKPVASNIELKSTEKGIQFTANASGPSADYKPLDDTVTWLLSTTDQKYAAVDQTGLVTLTPEGKKVTSNGRIITVTAKANDGSGKFSAAKVVIKFLKG